jgi:hypothetical protein
MARGTSLATVLQMVKAETAKANQTAQDAEIMQIIANTQQWLASEFDWPFLKGRWDVTIPVRGRYASFPTVDSEGTVQLPNTVAIDFERSGQLKVWVKWNNVWQEVFYGIREQEEYNYIDSDEGQILDPIQRWAFADQGQFEVWPMPASNTLIRFTGQRVPMPLQKVQIIGAEHGGAIGGEGGGVIGGEQVLLWNPSATLDLDDILVTYYAAAEYMIREDQTDLGRMLLQAGQTRMAQIRATYPLIERPAVIVGGGTTIDRRALRIVPLVLVGGR